MAPIQSTIVKYGSHKTCFLIVPEKWINNDSGHKAVPVFKVEYGRNQTAYFSGKTAYSVANDIVHLNGKYALTLGLNKDEQVLIQKMEDQYSPVDKVFLQPLHSDDWEMMQLNASTVERELLNQIRIVWKDQVFPVWVNQTTLFVKVVDLSPPGKPAILVEFTEIYINPNERSHIQSPPKKRKEDVFKQYQHLRRRNESARKTAKALKSGKFQILPHRDSTSPLEQPSVKGPVIAIFEYLMKSAFLSETDSPSSPKKDNSNSNFRSVDFDFSLRVLSFSRFGEDTFSLPLGIQSTTVFISERTFCRHFGSSGSPECFVANLSKLYSPLQKSQKPGAESRDSRLKEKSKKEKKDNNEETDRFSSVYVNIIVLKSEEDGFAVPRALFRSTDFICVPRELKRRLGLEISSRVRLRGVDAQPFIFDTISLHPMDPMLHFDLSQIKPAFCKWVEEAASENSSIVLCDGTLVKLVINKGQSCDYVVTLMHSDNPEQNSSFLHTSSSSTSSSERSFLSTSSFPSYGFLNAEMCMGLHMNIKPFSQHMKKSVMGAPGTYPYRPESLYQTGHGLTFAEMGGVKDIAKTAIADFEIGFKLRPALSMSASPCAFSNSGALLVTGDKGAGKTTFVLALCKNFINYPHFVFNLHIQCLPFRGKRIESITRKWELALSECVHRQPSVLIFDDLHQLASTPQLDNGPDAVYFSGVAQVFLGLLEKILVNNHRIIIVATSKSIHSLHPLLTNEGGRRVFHSVIELKPPDVAQRCEILQSLIKTKSHISSDCIESMTWPSIAAKTEGYIAQDLRILLRRALHAAWVRIRNQMGKKSYGQVSLVDEDFTVALTGYTPAALRDLHLQKGNNKTWKDVGGLRNVKEALQQTLTWPTKYKFLYSNCGIKPQQNILLYGPPGTGKTLIAGVVATECELNFICIKGPELLSKFIGASEQAVRDLFTRAMSAKPCVLFFDEFDALAPRRGHDSTGVTDRVVNQLLTQMDGVESLEGVNILAATSKPELIDPALLRPGRFDKCIFCPLPNQLERLEILKCLSNKLPLSDDVDFESIAAITEHYSGADLQALLYSAQIMAFHDIEDKKIRTTSLSSSDINSAEFAEDMIYVSPLKAEASTPPLEEARAVMQEMDLLAHKIANLDVRSEDRKHKRSSCFSIVVEQRHLLEVLQSMKPSVSREERLRYQQIFNKFQQTGGMDFSVLNTRQRVTLA